VFALDGVVLRPLEVSDIDTLYAWSVDIELNVLAGWGRPRSRDAFHEKHERRIREPEDDLVVLGVEREGRLAGYAQLALIDRVERRAAVAIVLGDKATWGRGVGRTALRILADYAFTALNLERLYAEVYGFNLRSQRLMERVGFRREGVLRQHETHNGARQDVHIFGLLKAESYQRYPTLLGMPDAAVQS